MSRYIRERYKNFNAYTPGEQPKEMEYVKLNTNESPFPPAPGVSRCLDEVDMKQLRLYPDPTGHTLKAKIAELYDVEPENVFLSNGSDDILNFSMMAWCDEDDKLLFPDISYSFYEVIAKLHDVNYRKVPLQEDMTIDYRDYCQEDTNIIIPNPNAPTGIALTLDVIEEIVKANPNHVVLIDEAYVDFGADSAVPLIKKYDNILISQTFSKSRSFAGGRLGFAIGDKGLIGDLITMQYSTNPYSVNTMSLILAGAALDEDAYYRRNSEIIQKNREWTGKALSELGFTVLPSKANFVFAKHPKVSGEKMYLHLKEKGVLVRHFTTERIQDYVRITIGTENQMQVLIDKVKEILQEA